jgi:hypothetical protein
MMTITYTNGQPPETAEDFDAALDILFAAYPDATYGRRDGHDVEPEEGLSVLVWRNETEAGPRGNGDDGSRAIAEISVS